MSLAGAFRKITKGVKKAVKGVGKAVKGVYKGPKKLLKNKYVRMGLLIAAACTLPPLLGAAGLGATAGLGLSAVSNAERAMRCANFGLPLVGQQIVILVFWSMWLVCVHYQFLLVKNN